MPETRRILLDGAVTLVKVDGSVLRTADGREVDAGDAVHLPPTEPTKIIACHLNYKSRVDEFMTRLPPAPTYFHKPTTSLNSHLGEVIRPEPCKYLNFEGEIAIVIGRECRNVGPEEAADHIAGYTIANDYGLHDFRDTDAGSMLRVKGSDTLCPVGPGVTTAWDFRDKGIRTLVNGEVRQEGDTSEMEWDMHYLVAGIDRPGPRRCAAQDDVTRQKGDGTGDVRDQVVHVPLHLRSVSRLSDLAIHQSPDVLVVKVPVGHQPRTERAQRVRAFDAQHRAGVGVPEVVQPEVVCDGVSGDVVRGIVLGDVERGASDDDRYLPFEIEVLAPEGSHHISQVGVERRRRLVEVGGRRGQPGHEFLDPAPIGEMSGDDLGRLHRWEVLGLVHSNSFAVWGHQLVVLDLSLDSATVDEDPSIFGHRRDARGFRQPRSRIRPHWVGR